MLLAASFVDWRKETRSAPGRRGPALVMVVLVLLVLGLGALNWPQPAARTAALLLGLLIFPLGLLIGWELGRRESRAAKPAPPVVAPMAPAHQASYQPQEIRCNPFFELCSSSPR
ncbi:hypothetical protein [Hymenobacter chitinivorans]|uniref:Uncharacterized protein n=1 Tax=Hymenobacter chitinivorans DSM 11115 TaxID=1121954 RepID=A0A2M9APY8_9BACT|nr:hypothetical protein [Hymenobacter chitinivorans]PJJ47764.1 hypothetical protein CLV45_4902 [Hymenobacter chitinivorans DSM 11115]